MNFLLIPLLLLGLVIKKHMFLLIFIFSFLSPVSYCFCSIAFTNGNGAGVVLVIYSSAGGGCSNPDYTSGQYIGTYSSETGEVFTVSGDADPDVCFQTRSDDDKMLNVKSK